MSIDSILCLLGIHTYDRAAVWRKAERMSRIGVNVRDAGKIETVCCHCGKRFLVRP